MNIFYENPYLIFNFSNHLFVDQIEAKQKDIEAQMMISYSHRPNQNSRSSPIWRVFQMVYDKEGNEVIGFYYCISCKNVVYSSHAADGTTAQLLRHECVEKEVNNLKHVDNTDFDGLKRAAAKFVCMDLRPFTALECPGLQDLIMAGVKLGKKHHKMTLDDLKRVLPSRNTVKAMVTCEAQEARESIKNLFQKAIENNGFGCTIDLWSDKYNHCSYLAMTANMFLVEGVEIVQKRLVFHMGKVGEIVKSKEVIRKRIFEVFAEYGLTQDDIKQFVTFTTDR